MLFLIILFSLWCLLLKIIVKDKIRGALFPFSVVSLLIIWVLMNSFWKNKKVGTFELITFFASYLQLLTIISMALISVTSAILVTLSFISNRLRIVLKIFIEVVYILSSVILLEVFQQTSDFFIKIRTNVAAKVIWNTVSTNLEWILPAFWAQKLFYKYYCF